jgi:hypothetical protein
MVWQGQGADPVKVPMSIQSLSGKVYVGSTSSVKLRSFDDAVSFIDDDGSFKGHTSSYYMIKEAEALLAKYGYCEVVGEVHPVDKVANFVVSNKWYWGGVLGLSAVPGLVVGLDELKRLEHEITS